MMMRLLLVVLLVLLSGSLRAAEDQVVPLAPNDVSALLEPPAQGERILLLWSLSCVYCEPAMEALAKLERAHAKRIQLVTVATDHIGHAKAIAARLQAAGMTVYPARAYTEQTPARTNFLIDPDWGGVLPHILVIRADGTRSAMSGVPGPAQLAEIAP